MADTTTIEITTGQKAELDDLKSHDREAYKSVIADLLEGYSKPKSDGSSDVSGELADIHTELTEIKSELRRFK
jgi:hypothetical protein